MSMHARQIRSASLALLVGLCVVLIGVGQGEAREVEIDGTADCGLRSARRCSIEGTLAIWTDDVTGTRERFEVDVSWIQHGLDSIDQDDRVCLLVEDRNAVRLKAIGLSHHCKFDGTINPGLSTGDKEVREQPRHAQDNDAEEKPVTVTPTDTPGTTGPPGSSGPPGTVTNALTGQPLPDATVRDTGSGVSTTTGSNGRFTLSGVPSGTRTMRASASGFVTAIRTVAVVAGGSTDVAISLTPGRPGGEITIVLTWGGQPPDLDAHLSGPNRGGGRFHIYFANPTEPASSPYASLDVDDTQSFGPETITIACDPTTGLFAAGEYRYWVHNFSLSPEFDVSNAVVTVNSGGAQLEEFNVPGGASGLDIWRVVNLTVDTAGNVSLTPIQSFTTGFSSTPFGVPEGSVPTPTRK